MLEFIIIHCTLLSRKPLYLVGQRCKLPTILYFDDWDLPKAEVRYLTVIRDIPEAGYYQAESLEAHYRKLFRLGFEDDSYVPYDEE